MTHILIVDDEYPVAALVQKFLENRGYTCATAGDAAQAKEMLAAKAYDLLISDLRMPGESGLDLILFAKQTYPGLAMVVLSMIDDPQLAESVLKAGVYGYVIKPFDSNQLLITLQNALIRRDLELKAQNLHHTLQEMVRHRTEKLEQTIAELKEEKSKSAAVSSQLQDQLLLMQTLRDAIPSPIYYKDVAGIYRGCNKAFETYLGRSREQIVGKTINDIAPKERAQIHAQADAELFKSQKQQAYEAQVKYADGTLHEVLITKAVCKNANGRIDGLVGVMIDITERNHNERALRMSEEKSRQILDNIGIGVALISPEMTVLEMNNKMRQWFPKFAAESRPLCYSVFVDPPRREPCEGCPTFQTLQDGLLHEAVVVKKDAQASRTFRIISSAIRDSNGQVAGAIELLDDITEKIAMERELLQTQKMASIGQLAAGVAHEINNPTGFVSSNLTTLSGYRTDLDQLIDEYQRLKQSVKAMSDSPLQEVIARIEDVEARIDIDYIRTDMAALIGDCRSGMDRIKRIVEDLKHFAHPGQDKVQDTDINKELETTLNVVHNELKYKATVIKEFGDLPIIKANPQQLNQVFINILVNAAQAIEKMGEIRVKTQQINGHVQIHISDTGSGIAAENLTRIFDPFFTTKEVGKGTGLGMNIAYNIIKKHRGEILVQSRLGLGTEFIIRLPVENSSDQTAQDQNNTVEQAVLKVYP